MRIDKWRGCCHTGVACLKKADSCLLSIHWCVTVLVVLARYLSQVLQFSSSSSTLHALCQGLLLRKKNYSSK